MKENKITREDLSKIAKTSRAISYDELIKLSSFVEKTGGQLINFEPDKNDDYCGSCGVKIPYIQKERKEFYNLLNQLLSEKINFEVLINGIPEPEELYLQLFRTKNIRT